MENILVPHDADGNVVDVNNISANLGACKAEHEKKVELLKEQTNHEKNQEKGNIKLEINFFTSRNEGKTGGKDESTCRRVSW